MEYTTNYRLLKPHERDFYDIQNFNDNSDIIDTKLKDLDGNLTQHNGNTQAHKGAFLLTQIEAKTPENTQKATLLEYLFSLREQGYTGGTLRASKFKDLPSIDWGYNIIWTGIGSFFVIAEAEQSSGNRVYFRDTMAGGVWTGDWIDVKDADTVDGKHATDLQNYDNLTNKPAFKTVATSGSYNDLVNKPTIPTSLPANGGDADTVDGKHATDLQNYDNLTNKPAFKTVATSGSYNDLVNKPTIPTTLPANGGNAHTVDGKHATDFPTSHDTPRTAENTGFGTILEYIMSLRVSGFTAGTFRASKFSDLPGNKEWGYNIRWSGTGSFFTIAESEQSGGNRIYFRDTNASGAWEGEWKKCAITESAEITLRNNWTLLNGSPKVYRAGCMCSLAITISNRSQWAPNNLIADIPDGFRPIATTYFGTVKISPDGTLKVGDLSIPRDIPTTISAVWGVE